MLQYILF